jgi:hypothetical protein
VKPNARVLDITDTLVGEEIDLSIDPGAWEHLMTVMTDMYSDPELAVIREYSTNARDSHIEAGQTRPVEITLPSSLAPEFRVRDFGVGLGVEEIRDIYSKYGASTKRTSNDVVGMLGIGCKSALTYQDQFTVTGIKDGIKIQVSVSRKVNGVPKMTIVHRAKTDEPSGVEIVVPVKSYNEFERKSQEFFRFWDKGTVLINGEEPKYIDGLWVTDKLLLTKDVNRSMIVMGNVAYPIPNEYQAYDRYHSMVAFVEIGEIDFTPSRESLQMTAKTEATVTEVKEELKRERDKSFAKQIEEAPTHVEALRLTHEATQAGFSATPMYKGAEVIDCFESPKDDPFVVVASQKYYRAKGWQHEDKLLARLNVKRFWLVGYDEQDFSPYKRQKLVQWMEEKGHTTPDNFILVRTLPNPEWIDPSTVHPWAEVKAQKIVRENVKRRDGRPSGSYEGYVAQKYSRTINADQIDTTQLFWVDNRRGMTTREQEIINTEFPQATVILLGGNRITKFQRDFPMAEELSPFVKKLAEDWKKKLTHEEKLAIHLADRRDVESLLKLDHEEIVDPELSEAVRIVKNRDKKVCHQFQMFYNWVGEVKPANWTNPLHSYPLLEACLLGARYGTMTQSMKDHMYLYINAAYAAEKEKV